MKNSILFHVRNSRDVPDFHGLHADWEPVPAFNSEHALQALLQRPYCAVITDYTTGEGEEEFLVKVMHRFPNVVRIGGYDPATIKSGVKSNGVMQQFIPKPFDAETLVSAIQRARLVNTWMSDPSIKTLFPLMRKLPSVPSVYLRLNQKLQSPDASMDDIGALIAEDPVMTAKVLQLVNSAYFGLGHNITSPAEAAGFLGVERIRALMLLVHTFSTYDEEKSLPLKIESVWRHSLATASWARAITREETRNTKKAETAFTGGLLHDLGKLMLAVNLPDKWRAVADLAGRQRLDSFEAEREVFGASHAEMGACVLGIWGLPADIVESIAYHHTPAKHFSDNFGPVCAVHVANVLAHEMNPEPGRLKPPRLDEEYLRRIGVAGRLDEWRRVGLDAAAPTTGGGA